MQGLRLVRLKGIKRIHRFSGSMLQGLRHIKAEGSKEVSQDFSFSVAGTETCKGCRKEGSWVFRFNVAGSATCKV